MRVSNAKAAEHREQILAAAARLFRERGFTGISVAELMKEAGLTHGGFYGHFSSKDDLIALACQRAVTDMLGEWAQRAQRTTGDPLLAITRPYLSAAHRDEPGTGCLMASLGPDVSRQRGPVRRAVTESFRAVLDTITALSPGRTAQERRKAAIATFASLVGALVIARAIDDAETSEEVLGAVSAAIAAQQRRDRRERG